MSILGTVVIMTVTCSVAVHTENVAVSCICVIIYRYDTSRSMEGHIQYDSRYLPTLEFGFWPTISLGIEIDINITLRNKCLK